MHKRFVNQCTLDISLIPKGPVLIKSGQEGADPTKPSMEFVETFYARGRSIYFPGSSLKGPIRAHAERIVRTIGSDTVPSKATREDKKKQPLWASDPLKLDGYKYLEEVLDSATIYRWSSFTDQLFGSVEIASRLRISDAYPVDVAKVRTEERNGVAIDRVFGSVAVGPFDYEVCTAGEFQTKIYLKNFTLDQLGLLGLVLRDLDDGWFGLGFAKSRGMGLVQVKLNWAKVEYPGCVMDGEQFMLLGSDREPWSQNALLGAGMFLSEEERENYGFPADDMQIADVTGEAMDYGMGVKLLWTGGQVKALFRLAVQSWQKRLTVGASS